MTDITGASSCEAWRVVADFPIYKVSSHGRIKNVTNGRVLVGEIDADGYHRVNLVRNGVSSKRRVHRLVCEAFHGAPPVGCEVRHLDGVRLHNNEQNLCWGTRSENMQDSITHGTFNRDVRAATAVSSKGDRRGARNPNARLTDEQAREMLSLRREGHSERKIAAQFGCSPATAHRVLSGARYVG